MVEKKKSKVVELGGVDSTVNKKEVIIDTPFNSSSESCSKSDSNCGEKMKLCGMILLSTLLIIASNYYFINGLPTKLFGKGDSAVDSAGISAQIASKIESIEIEKAGGAENYALLKKLYSSKQFKDQQSSSLKSYLAQMGVDAGSDTSAEGSNAGADTGSSESGSGVQKSEINPNFTQGQITADQISKLKEGTHILGNENAKIVWFEFSDLECPYCKKLHDSGILDEITSKYKDDLAYIFKSYPLPFHKDARKASQTMECVGELAGKDAYYQFEKKAFATTVNGQGDVSYDTLKKIASELGVDGKKLDSCVDSGKYDKLMDESTKQGQELFQVQGTPGSVLVNVETGKWILIPGAFPSSEFTKAIDSLLGK